MYTLLCYNVCTPYFTKCFRAWLGFQFFVLVCSNLKRRKGGGRLCTPYFATMFLHLTLLKWGFSSILYIIVFIIYRTVLVGRVAFSFFLYFFLLFLSLFTWLSVWFHLLVFFLVFWSFLVIVALGYVNKFPFGGKEFLIWTHHD